MVDFFKRLSPEAQARLESERRNFEKDVAEFAAMPDDKLAERVEYFMKNCEFPHRYAKGVPVYDGVIAHVIIPELLKRIRLLSELRQPVGEPLIPRGEHYQTGADSCSCGGLWGSCEGSREG